MSKPSSSSSSARLIRGLVRLHYNHHLSTCRSSSSSSNATANAIRNFSSSSSSPLPSFSNSRRTTLISQFHSQPKPKPTSTINPLHTLRTINPIYTTGLSRLFSTSPNANFAKKVFDKPATALSSAFARYREAIGLQIEAFFKRNSLFLFGAAGVVLCALLWRIMFGIANTFVGLSEGMAKYGFLALSSAIVAFAVSSFSIIQFSSHSLE